MSPLDGSPVLRRDARRNQKTVLDAAERVFARAGLSASIETIAAEAGVGVGTVYRGFGSKAALIDTLFADRVGAAVEVIERCGDAPTGAEALVSVLRAFVQMQSRSRAFRQVLFQDAERDAHRLRAEIEPLLTAIIDRAKREGAVRTDFAATDIPILTHAISQIATLMPQGGPELARRHLELLLKGIAAGADDAVIPPPLADERFAEWMRAVGGEDAANA